MGPAKCRVRVAESTDSQRIIQLLSQLGYDSTPAQVEARLRRRQELGGRHEIWVAELDGTVCGVMAASLETRLGSDEQKVHVTELVVDRAVRGKGIGKNLINAAAMWGTKQNADLLFVLSNQQRTDAHEFYRALNFEETHRTFKLPLV